MAKPKEVLSPEDYSNYRNVRAVSILFLILGSFGVIGGIGLTLDEDKTLQDKPHPAVAIGVAIAGLAGAIGGFAALRGSRKWAALVYVMATLYIFVFPVGTILSIVMIKGLPGYLDSVDRVRGSFGNHSDLSAPMNSLS